MPSTYSTSLKLQLIGTGEQAGTWGTTTNTNLGTLLEQAITGVITIPMGDATYTLSNFNGLSDEARNAVLILNGPITAPQFLVAPPGQQKVYIVRNRTGNTVTLTTGTGSNISVANAASEVLFTDGANVFSATQFNFVNGDLTITGTATANNLVATNNITLGKDLFANSSTGQVYLPTGNTAQRTASPIVGLIRYNTTGQFYEGYTNAAWVRFTVAPQNNYTITYVIIAGGGGGAGGTGGGGGAGGMLQGSFTATPTITYTLAIGGGGGTNTSGSNSFITGIATATGGGNGGASNNSPNAGSGGSGGGQGINQFGGSPGAGISGQGFGGGSGSAGAASFSGAAGGGGGGGAVGATAPSTQTGGAGGAGNVTTITGTTLTFAGGGGGAADAGNAVPTGGAGGTGGGGSGSAGFTTGGNGTANTGSGGGGGQSVGGSGGSGLIYISMPTVNFSGNYTGLPTITTSGAETILKYTNSGTYIA